MNVKRADPIVASAVGVALLTPVLLTGATAPRPGAAILDKTAELRAANYAADAAAVTRLLGDLRTLAADDSSPDRWLAHYQAAAASSLLAAFVGPGSLANPAGDVPQMQRHMAAAAESLEAAIALAPSFADAHAALANNYGIRSATESDAARRAELVAKARAARQRSLELEPRNPRVVAGHAGQLFWTPPQYGGDPRRGIERYREALALFAAEPAAEGELHCWGEPDTWAFLGLAYLMLQPPDAAAGKAAVAEALRLRPDFAWARQALLPRAAAALRAKQAQNPQGRL